MPALGPVATRFFGFVLQRATHIGRCMYFTHPPTHVRMHAHTRRDMLHPGVEPALWVHKNGRSASQSSVLAFLMTSYPERSGRKEAKEATTGAGNLSSSVCKSGTWAPANLSSLKIKMGFL